MIFELCKAASHFSTEDLDSDSSSEDFLVYNIPFELLIAQVSQYFRRVAFETHTLWTSIQIKRGCSIDRIAAYIDRSATRKLDVRADFSCSHELQSLEMIELINRQANRWRRLSIIGSMQSSGEDVTMVQLLSKETPALEYLSLSLRIEARDREDVAQVASINVTQPRILTQGVPKLSFLRLRGFAMHLLQFPSTKLVTLHLDQTTSVPISISRFCEFVAAASSSLENLSIYGDVFAVNQWPEERTINLPALRSLRLSAVEGQMYSTMLLCLDAPGLDSLYLKEVREHDLDRFCDSSNALKFRFLTSLTFCDFDFSSPTYRRIFQVFPAIEKFSTCASVSSPLSQLLGEPAGQATPCRRWPHLRTLTVLFDIYDEVRLIEDMVKGREASGCPLELLRFTTNQEGFRMLRENLHLPTRVDVERYTGGDIWPANRNYPDDDDELFL